MMLVRIKEGRGWYEDMKGAVLEVVHDELDFLYRPVDNKRNRSVIDPYWHGFLQRGSLTINQSRVKEEFTQNRAATRLLDKSY